MSRDNVRIGCVSVRRAPRRVALDCLRGAVAAGQPAVFSFVNAHTVNLAGSNKTFAEALSRITLFNDGIGLDIAGKLLGHGRFPDNLNGTDLIPELLGELPAGTRVFLLGSPPGVAEVAMANLAARFPRIAFVGAAHGYFPPDQEQEVADRITRSAAQLVLVGMGQPRQEQWSLRNAPGIGAVMLCAGALLDFSAERFARAPHWVRQLRIEWFYRLIHEPRRLAKRYLIGNFAFMGTVVGQRIAALFSAPEPDGRR